jgi:quercetin dioxygenase-like cupin family protein
MKRGFETKAHAHDTEEQVFIVLEGRGEITLEDEKRELEKGVLVYIPRGAKHRVVAISDELVYIYITIWPDGRPPGLKAKVYQEGRVVDIMFE